MQDALKLPQRFARWLQVDPSSQQELPFIDGFRALAVSMVVALHTWQFAGGPLLLIGTPLIGGNISLGHYLQYARKGPACAATARGGAGARGGRCRVAPLRRVRLGGLRGQQVEDEPRPSLTHRAHQ